MQIPAMSPASKAIGSDTVHDRPDFRQSWSCYDRATGFAIP